MGASQQRKQTKKETPTSSFFRQIVKSPALLDSGADITVIPQR